MRRKNTSCLWKDAKALVQIVHGRLGKRVYDSAGIACTQDTSRQSGLYFVDLTKGDPKITPNARCLHTRQDGSLTNFKGQNSGVLYIEDQIDKILAINSDAQAYKQAGNSVTVTVIEAIGRPPPRPYPPAAPAIIRNNSFFSITSPFIVRYSFS